MRNSLTDSVGCCLIATAVVLFSANAAALAGDPPPHEAGVCCHPTIGCMDAEDVHDDCFLNELPYFIGATCEEDPCEPPPVGACCLEGSCQDNFTQSNCINQEGIYQGPGSFCTPNICAAGVTGACCLGTQCIENSTLNDCASHDGEFQGPGSDCTPSPCGVPTTGACCFGFECAPNTTESECANNEGVFQGLGSDCSPNPCLPAQACCFDTGTCQMLSPSQCGGGGGITLDGQDCGTAPCGAGACCTGVQCISNILAFTCLSLGYLHQGTGSSCDPDPCGPNTQACCFGDSTCQELSSNDCSENGGTPQGIGTTCEEADCGTVACCLPEEEECMLLSASACFSNGGILQGGPACEPNPCASGACCTPTCQVIDAYTCIFNGYSFQGAGTACIPGLCVQPCVCINDVNRDFIYNAADIQAFVDCATGLSEDCSCADNDFDGQTTAADIPSFINSIMNTTGECL